MKASGAGQQSEAESPVCPYCAGQTEFLIRSTDYNRGTTDAEFSYFQCAACGMVSMDRIPGDLRPFYAGGYGAVPETRAALRVIAAPEVYRMETVLRHKRGGRLLEIGPWRGVFAINAQDAGFEVSAIEMDGECVRFLRDTLGVNAVQSIDPANAMLAMTERFDVIALWHSLEHLKEPWKVVESAAERLAPGGILLLALPNIESFEFHLLRERWRHLDAPRHLHFYPVASLSALAARNGLRTVEIETHDYLSELLAKDTWYEWSKRWFGEGWYTGRLTTLLFRLAGLRERRQQNSGAGITAVFQAAE